MTESSTHEAEMLDLTIELGRTTLQQREVDRLAIGSLVPLDCSAVEPVNVYANGRLVARGEILVVNDCFSVRVTERVAGVDALA